VTLISERRPSTAPEFHIGRADRFKGSNWALATITLVLFLTFLDNTIVSVVLANVQSALHAGVSSLQWVVNGYALTFAAFMLSFGTLGDIFGRKKVMLAGVGIFCAGSVLCALALDVNALIAGRVVMGIGAAASESGTLSMIRHLYAGRTARARALGVWAAVSGLALGLGPVIGGALTGLWSWRAIFWFNLFFGAAALVAAAMVLPENADPQNRRIDLPGAALGAAALGSVVNGQLTNNLVGQLAAIGIPAQYRSEVVTAVTTGNVSGPETAASKNPAVASIVHRVIEAAYGAFSHGMDLSLMAAAALMLLGAVVAASTMPRSGEHGGDHSSGTMAKGRLNARRPHTVIDLRQESLSAVGLGYWARDSRTALDGRWLR